MNERIVEAFGKYMADINGKIIAFEDRSEAETAVALALGKEEMTARAAAYCAARNLEGRNAVGKSNTIIDFLAFEASVA